MATPMRQMRLILNNSVDLGVYEIPEEMDPQEWMDGLTFRAVTTSPYAVAPEDLVMMAVWVETPAVVRVQFRINKEVVEDAT